MEVKIQGTELDTVDLAPKPSDFMVLVFVSFIPICLTPCFIIQNASQEEGRTGAGMVRGNTEEGRTGAGMVRGHTELDTVDFAPLISLSLCLPSLSLSV